jgi:hypothetical protein
MLALRRLFQRKTDYLTFRAVMEQPIMDIRHYRPDCPDLLASALARALSASRACCVSAWSRACAARASASATSRAESVRASSRRRAISCAVSARNCSSSVSDPTARSLTQRRREE